MVAGGLLAAGGGATAVASGVTRLEDHRGTALFFSSLVAAGLGLVSLIAGGGAIGTANAHLEGHVLSYDEAVDAANQYDASLKGR